MSVFTPLQQDEISEFLSDYRLGDLVSHQGIQGGSENTNYFVITAVSGSLQHWVLTLIERGPIHELPFFVELLESLHQQGLSVPYALPDCHGQRIHQLKGRPALLQPCLPGEHPTRSTPELCHALGVWLARMHTATKNTSLNRQSDRSPRWVVTQAQSLLASQWQSHKTWLSPALDHLESWLQSSPTMPISIIHGDLFRDNAMVSGDAISGVIDFYNAYRGWTLMDIAICVNDWCIDFDTGVQPKIQKNNLQALISGYQTIKPLTPSEAEHWLSMLQLAALRFWVSRQLSWTQSVQQQITVKDPAPFGKLFQCYRELQLSHATDANW